MKAFVVRSYGPPEVLRLTDVDRPEPGDREVLVRVRATSVQPYDWHHMRGEPYVARLMPGTLGLRAPKIGVLGADVAGRVEKVGANVSEFRPGDEVYALVAQGGFAEYACVPADRLARKPENLTFEQAAAVPLAGVTALYGLCGKGRMRSGQRVLVNGASGGVGTFAVQIAAASGAAVTGVCGTRNLDLVRSLGAGEVVDYTAQDFTRQDRRHDLLLDVAGNRSARACRRALTPKGTYVAVGGPQGRWLQPVGHVFAAAALSPLVSQRTAMADVYAYTGHKQSLMRLTELIEAGKVAPVIDRTFPFDDIPAAVAYQEDGHATGKVVITI
ncbi:zinc-binding dehydrogenase [Actinomadura sp. LD22]|uniref:Zinc-binding dehydrogenase n=1 Tax=Actinomadura physcomitrii TaxID=2650748 RepID=A0A6I4M1V8_9ACTN|nr:NAD(P)-dependent alcohol dehydrogenase [Actinomadura physcomitrii]MVZ99742.1 zinc-binding dehydrogenase [Actinomadura physcomitrii]